MLLLTPQSTLGRFNLEQKPNDVKEELAGLIAGSHDYEGLEYALQEGQDFRTRITLPTLYQELERRITVVLLSALLRSSRLFVRGLS